MGVYLGSNAVDMQGGFVSGGSSDVKLQSKTVSPSESTQTVSPDSGYDGLSISIHALLAESDSKSAQNSGALLRI